MSKHIPRPPLEIADEYEMSAQSCADFGDQESAAEDMEVARTIRGLVRDLAAAVKDSARMDWMADSYGAAGLDQASAEEEARTYERAYGEAKKRGMADRGAVRFAVDAAIALRPNVPDEPRDE
ncbi:hypothetical protein [Geminisphaera colitermitum]|uniref:hypothetical protein n=1 Tax=Geminisphaera colitermitum TaxID=1148786 RepID=UPI000158D152|nr:hypothetical protein [Geminisphaera colitermitum]